jgi:magnesium-transporting ATPase (P-type)
MQEVSSMQARESVTHDAKPWHTLAPDAVLAELASAPAGLSGAEASARLARYGPNRLPQAARRSAWRRLLLQFHNILIYVLLGAAVITAALEHLADTLVILAVVVANALIGFVQEGKAEQAMDAIRDMLAPNAAVLRAGRRHTIPGDQLVPGDIVLLDAGDKVPADLRILQAHGLQIQEAILTGESVAVGKRVAAVAPEAPLGDRTCLAFSGTLVTSGQGRGVVTGTGAATEIGRISDLLAEVKTLTTPLVRQMDVFARWLTLLILAIAALLLSFGYFVERMDFTEMFMVVVGLSVAAIPEGLPAVLTITLAIGVQAMAKRHAIVRRLPAIETLGAVSVICTDKTGTLTRNEMMVASVIGPQWRFAVTGSGYAPEGEIRTDEQAVATQAHAGLRQLALAAALCNDAELHEGDAGWTVEGDPMEGALLAFAGKAGVDSHEQKRQWPRTDTISFDARHCFMATLNHDHEGHAFIFVKGAPERILGMCEAQRAADGATAALDVAAWRSQADAIAAEGQRVLAFACRAVEPAHVVLEHADVEGSLTLLGMTGLIDPPRPEAVSAVAECHSAGIRVKMITGDHAGTARAIALQIGLQNAASVLTGTDLDKLDDAALGEAVLNTDIFARTSPEHKLRLVSALQAHGLTVAMTGDGVNDAPALKRADAGIAMGRKGSEAAREAAELVLADDNFASIVAAVREGRTVYDNIKKVITWTLPTNAGEAMTIIVALLFGMNLPVTPIQILWINLITATTLGLALAFEPTEARTMCRPPRQRNEALLTGALVRQIILTSVLFLGGVFGLYFHAIAAGHTVELARTIAMNTLVVMEIFYLFIIRNIHDTSLTLKAVSGTPVVWLTVGIVTLAQFAITYLPPLQTIFETRAVPLREGLLIVGTGVVLLALLELEKLLRLRRRPPPA